LIDRYFRMFIFSTLRLDILSHYTVCGLSNKILFSSADKKPFLNINDITDLKFIFDRPYNMDHWLHFGELEIGRSMII